MYVIDMIKDALPPSGIDGLFADAGILDSIVQSRNMLV